MTPPPFISHAPHQQDVMLWRALRAEAAGRWIQLGAGGDALLRGLAEQGWQGRQMGALPDQAEPGELHVLVVGPDVPPPAQLRTVRPWIVVIEAVRAESGEPAGGAWAAALAGSGYIPVWFDGVHRFYLADERYAALADHFLAPPNPFDAYVTADHLAAERLRKTLELREAELARLRPPPAAPVPVALAARHRRAVRLAYGLVRPVLRPIAWRLRSFLTGPLRDELLELRRQQDALLARLDQLAAERRDGEALLLTAALERER